MRNITPGLFVRLAFDTKATTVGYVTDTAPAREYDGQPFVLVDWQQPDSNDDGDPMPTSILVPVCEWFEPVNCYFDAERIITNEQGTQFGYCTEHAVAALRNTPTGSITDVS